LAGLTGFEPATFSVTGRRALRCSTTPRQDRGIGLRNFCFNKITFSPGSLSPLDFTKITEADFCKIIKIGVLEQR
jgi:hypothetical protein